MRLLAMGDRGWEAANLSSYANEDELERLLLSDTSLIPGAQGSTAVTQYPLAGGAADLFCLDGYGTMTIVECKLQINREVRRQVIGQIFAYAAALSELDARAVIDRFNHRLSAIAGLEAAGGPRDVVGVISASAGREISADELYENVATNLERGAVRLVIAVDGVVDELRSVIEYLSKNLPEHIQLVALEVGQFQQEGVRLLAVDSYGNEVELNSALTPQSVKHRWTREEVTSAVKAMSPLEGHVISTLIEHADSRQAQFNGGIGPDPSAGFYYTIEGKRRSFWSLWMAPGKEAISVNLGSINNASPTKVREVIELLCEYEYFASKFTGVVDLERRYPNFLVAELAADEVASIALRRAFELAGGWQQDL